ncbi:hypothetical protein HDV00_007404 [Rhizophlyctis rosea]|nr:hypothetical protein HDV00_007404 [Rhizophlyctis rosea]
MLETPQLEAVSGFEWNGDEMDHLFVKFVLGSAPSHIAPDVQMSAEARLFLDSNTFVCEAYFDQPSAKFTTFSDMMYHVLNRPREEAGVDDMILELLRSVFGRPQFLVKSRTKLSLDMSVTTRKRKRVTEATADCIVYKRRNDGSFKKGVCALEDKSYMYREKVDTTKAAEAQLFAEGIAVAQQKDWNLDEPVYLMRVMGTRVSFYVVQFTADFLDSVKSGERRFTPLNVPKLVPAGASFESGDVGFDLLRPNHRETVVQTLANIAAKLKEIP